MSEIEAKVRRAQIMNAIGPEPRPRREVFASVKHLYPAGPCRIVSFIVDTRNLIESNFVAECDVDGVAHLKLTYAGLVIAGWHGGNGEW